MLFLLTYVLVFNDLFVGSCSWIGFSLFCYKIERLDNESFGRDFSIF